MAAPCGRGALRLVLIAVCAAFLTYNALLSSRSLLPLPTASFPAATTAASSRRLASGRSTGSNGGRRLFHTAVTASGSVYNTWQCRVMYHWFKEARRRPGGADMGGFTRILHSGSPTSSSTRSPPSSPTRSPTGRIRDTLFLIGHGHLFNGSRRQTFRKKPDHLIVKPIPNLSRDGRAAAFPFFYIEPKKYEKVLRKFFPENEGPITKIDPIGNSPVIIEKESLSRIAPTWMNISLAMKKDPEADKAFGWVLEMYAYAVSSALHGVGNILQKDFMIQPPWDLEIGDSFIIHYTYGCDYDMKGKLTYGKIGEWRFDKRSYENKPPPRNLPLPPNGVPRSVVTLVNMVNEATTSIPNWESYAAE
ncbi:hypothetical protein D1007_48634 [Hordeum vulgare]|nr:hypothetical protein D1007_48634 [Hordeum vulgare]